MANPTEHFTLPGRVLIFLSLIAGGASVGLYTADFYASLPSGSYPLWFLLIPGLVAFAVVFGIGAAVYKLVDLRILKSTVMPADAIDSDIGGFDAEQTTSHHDMATELEWSLVRPRTATAGLQFATERQMIRATVFTLQRKCRGSHLCALCVLCAIQNLLA